MDGREHTLAHPTFHVPIRRCCVGSGEVHLCPHQVYYGSGGKVKGNEGKHKMRKRRNLKFVRECGAVMIRAERRSLKLQISKTAFSSRSRLPRQDLRVVTRVTFFEPAFVYIIFVLALQRRRLRARKLFQGSLWRITLTPPVDVERPPVRILLISDLRNTRSPSSPSIFLPLLRARSLVVSASAPATRSASSPACR